MWMQPIREGRHSRNFISLRQLGPDNLDRLVKLVINPLEFTRRVVVYDDIRVHPMAFDYPVSIRPKTCKLRLIQEAPVNEGQAPVDADHAAPGPSADDRAELVGAETERKDVPVTGGILVGQENLWSDIDSRVCMGNAIPGEIEKYQLLGEPVRDDRRNKAPTIAAVVDN